MGRMSKYSTLFVLALLLFVSLSQAARPQPVDPRTKQVEAVEETSFDEGCGGVGEEECLMRRTLVAHTDYIYTQGKKN